jgi:hypothetical protein
VEAATLFPRDYDPARSNTPSGMDRTPRKAAFARFAVFSALASAVALLVVAILVRIARSLPQ